MASYGTQRELILYKVHFNVELRSKVAPNGFRCEFNIEKIYMARKWCTKHGMKFTNRKRNSNMTAKVSLQSSAGGIFFLESLFSKQPYFSGFVIPKL